MASNSAYRQTGRSHSLRQGIAGAVCLCVLSASITSVSAAEPDQTGGAGRFRPVAVYVEAKNEPLAAYQIEVIAQGAEIVGVEGGEHPAFREPPYYDPAALRGGRIIIAAFSTGDDLPTGRTRVATLHMRETSTEPQYRIRLMAAATSDGERIPAVASLNDNGGDNP